MHKMWITLICLMSLLVSACDGPNTIDEDVKAQTEGPEFDLLATPVGQVSFPVSCNAAPLLERGVALTHHMMYEEARFVYNMAHEADPNCAMAHWGQAMTLIHPLWPDIATEKVLANGVSLMEKAAALGAPTDRENAYINTTAAYFENDPSLSEPQRLKAFEKAWQAVSEANPKDLEAKAFHTLSLIATAGIGDDSLIQLKKAGLMADEIMQEVDTHPGGHHYTIHAYDAPSLAQMALSTADRYGNLTPRVPHATHMMTHTYTRLGLWDKAIDWNTISAETALALCIETGEVNLHYTHALDYLAYAYLQKGDDTAVRKILAEADELKPPYSELTREASAYALSALPARYVLERRDWEGAVKLQPRMPSDFPWIEAYDPFVAVTHFTRALALSNLGRPEEANKDIDELLSIRLNIAEKSPYWAKQVEIQELAARAWQTYTSGDKTNGLAQMKMAADLEYTTDKHAVTPGEVLPSAELYGDMLLDNGQFEEALASYRVALVRSPGRLNSLYGAGKSAYGMGDSMTAQRYFTEMVENAENTENPRNPISEARIILSEL